METCCSCSKPLAVLTAKSINEKRLLLTRRTANFKVRASMLDSSESSSEEFVNRMEQVWLISQQPKPVVCGCCNSTGFVECQWCRSTGFFTLGDNVLCEVPSRNKSCVICAGKGLMRCDDCKGTGYLATWLRKPPISK